jgi:hypothetical protein
MRPVLSSTYRIILRLHPQPFRAEFGNEMLWIFEEESRNGSSLRLLLDGLCSIVVQNVRPRIQQAEAVGPIYREIDSSLPAERFAQATLVTLCCSLSLAAFLSMVVPRISAPVNDLLYTHIQLFSSIPSSKP